MHCLHICRDYVQIVPSENERVLNNNSFLLRNTVAFLRDMSGNAFLFLFDPFKPWYETFDYLNERKASSV